MRFNFKSSFDRLLKKLPAQKQVLILEAIEKLKLFYETQQLSQGLGLKNLRGNYWEIRSSLQDRILFSINGDLLSFLFIGNHDDIRKYLKNL